MVDVNDFPTGKVSGRDVKAVAPVFLDKTDHHVKLTAGFQQRTEDGIVLRWAMGNSRGQILQNVTGQRKFREDQQVGPFGMRFGGQGQVFF